MARALAATAAALLLTSCVVEADVCRFNVSVNACPGGGAACTSNILCAPGAGSCLASASSTTSQGTTTYAGKCSASALSFSDVYGRPCNPAAAFQCQYFDPLSASPYGYAALQCAPSPGSAYEYACLLGPNKAGDACFYNAECASGICSSKGNGEGDVGTNVCIGVSIGGSCGAPSAARPDPCASGLFCDPASAKCAAVAKSGQACSAAAGCERGTACTALNGAPARTCTPYLSVPAGATTGVGVYMCASGTGLALAGTAPQQYRCVLPNATLPATGRPCSPATYSAPGMECVCSASGVTLTRPVGGLGLGFNSQPYAALNGCLAGATSPTGQRCNFDNTDFERVRYGSCVYYGCFPHYKALVNGTGGRWYTAPLAQFTPSAPCEQPTLAAYFAALMAAPCITIPNLSNWKCMSLDPASFPPIGSTQALVTLIILAWFGGYWFHMRKYGGHGLDLLLPLVGDVPVLGTALKAFLKGAGGGGAVAGATQLK